MLRPSGRMRRVSPTDGSTQLARELPESVLIVRLGAIGDAVNATVLATALRRHSPRLRIGWAVHELSRPLVEAHPSIDRVHVWPRHTGLAGFVRVAREIR